MPYGEGPPFNPHMMPPMMPGVVPFAFPPSMQMQQMMDGVQQVSWLIGSWSGTGKASFPTMPEEIQYYEEATFTPVYGRPAIIYQQRTWRSSDHMPLHLETGFLRFGALAGGPGRAQMVVSQVTGLNFVSEGEIGEFGIEFHSTGFCYVATMDGPSVSMIKRRFYPRGDGTMGYTIHCSTGSESELVRCQEATLVPVSSIPMPGIGNFPPSMGSFPPGMGSYSQAMGVPPPSPAMVPDYSQVQPVMQHDAATANGVKSRNVPTPPRKDWGRIISHPSGKFVVEVHRDKFDGDAICIQCREMDNPWNRSGWIPCTFVDSQQVKHKVIQVSFEDKIIGKVYEIRAKVMGGQPTTMKQGGTLIVKAGDETVTEGTITEEDDAAKSIQEIPPHN
mmetsp:Transcript_21434/g.70999  ORF Transcript_21434/g.70999 Transcript_21434/m.70999 type:complete len:390 (-) Transcript_21434:64-1233(-)